MTAVRGSLTKRVIKINRLCVDILNHVATTEIPGAMNSAAVINCGIARLQTATGLVSD